MSRREWVFAFGKYIVGAVAAFSAGLLLAYFVGGREYLNQQHLVSEWLTSSTYRVANGVSRRVPEGPKGVCAFLEQTPPAGEAPFRTISRDANCEDYAAFSYAQLGPFKYALTGLSPLAVKHWSLAAEQTKQAAHPLGRSEPILLLTGIGVGVMALFFAGLRKLSRTEIRIGRLVCFGFLGITLCLLTSGLAQKEKRVDSYVTRQGIMESREQLRRGVTYVDFTVKTKAGAVVSLGAAYADLFGTFVQLELTESGDVACIRYAETRDCQPAAKQRWSSAIQHKENLWGLSLAAALFFSLGLFLKFRTDSL